MKTLIDGRAVAAPLCATFIFLVAAPIGASAQEAGARLFEPGEGGVDYTAPALYPEGIERHPETGEFLLGSIRKGAVAAVTPEGQARMLVEDPRLRSVVGIRVDAPRGRLLVVNSDYGASERSAPGEALAMSALAIYDLETGTPLQYVNLTGLRPGEEIFANDLDVGPEGDVYITDSLAAAIYHVTPAGRPSVFLTHERFRGDGFNLNGVQHHPDGFLLVAKKSDGSIFRVPTADPRAFGEVAAPRAFVGADGLLLLRPDLLLVIANRAAGQATNTAFLLRSEDGWRSAEIVDQVATGDVYATTGTVADGRIYVSFGQLHTLDTALEDGAELIQRFRIAELGAF